MSKLSFRARALDPCKPMPIYLAEELPDLPEYSAINRAVPQMPSGMEKEEESEHHLQRAICTGLIIPTPEVFTTEQDFYDRNYPPTYKMPRQLIHMQPLGLEQDIPDYDMDSADEHWVNSQMRRLDLTPLKFEQMMDRLEKSSGQTVVTLNEAKALLKQDDEVSIAVYDYWLNKRLKMQHPLILSVKTENRSGAAANNPYLAFRRRTEKMQTRKNRKNDETSYEKMLKLRRDLSRAVTLLEMVKRREKTKREQLHLSIEVFEKRFQIRDFNGSLMSELSSSIKSSRPAFAPLYSNQYSHHSSTAQSSLISSTSSSSQQQQQQQQQHHHHHYSTSQYHHSSGIGAASSSSTAATKRDLDSGSRKEKRQYKKRKHKLQREKHFTTQNVSSPAAVESTISSEEEGLAGQHLVGSEGEDEGLYSFRRNKNCEYHKPLTKNLGNWPWESKDDNGLADPKYRFTLTSIRHPRPRCVGFARRRMGRGGRVILDRMSTNGDDLWSQLDYTIFDSKTPNKSLVGDKIGTEAAASAEDENISRDLTYISTSSDPIVKPQSFWNNYCRKARHPLDTTNNTYNNSYSSLFGLITNNNSSSSISSSISHRENNSISDLLNKKIKRELPDSTYDVYDWSNDAHSDCRVQTSVDQLDTGVVDLVRTQCINRISNRNISNNNHTNYGSDNIRTILSSSNDKNKINVIKQEHATVIKQEFETDATNSDDENVNLASLSSLLNASRTTGSLSLSSFNQKLPKSEFLHSENLDLRQLTHSNYVNFNTSTKLLRCSSLPEVLCDGNESKLAVVSAAGEDENVNRSPDNKETIYNEFLEEIQKNWLHFHPKTPPTSPAAATYSFNDTDLASVNFSEQTAITIEMQRIGSSPPSSVFSAGIDTDPMFVSSAFAYNDLTGDEQILNTATTDSSNSVIDFNFSGDNLTELNLSLGEEDNEKMLDNILEECQIDDMKALNQTSIFWNGILEDGGLLDVIDDKKTILPEASKSELLVNGCGAATPEEKDCKKSAKRKSILHKSRVGNSQFSVTNAARDEKFFRKEDTSAAGQLLDQSIKIEPPEELLATPQKLQHSLSSSSQRASSSAVASNSLSQTIGSTNQATTILTNLNSANKIFIKQELTPTTAATNQVPTNLNQSQVITLSNVKLENDIGNIGLMTNLMSDAVVTPSNSISTAHVPSLLLAKQHQHQHQQQLLQQQHHQQQHQHILVQQITQASQTQMASAGVNTSMAYTDASGALLIASTSPNKRQINGPADKNSIQTILKQKYGNRKAPQPTIQTLKHHQQQQQPQYLDDDIISVVQTNQKPHQILQSGNFMKMSSYPVVVSEINSSQQQQQQNTLSASAVAVASNHNYSLQPSAQPLTIIGHQHQQGNKIILNTSSSGGTVTGGANFTISAPIQDLQNKLHYSQIPTSNIKVNLVTSSGIQQGSLIMDAKNSEMVKSTLQQHQQQLNTAQQQQQQQHQQQRIKLEKTVNMFIDPDQKRVLCKLVNLSSLQHKNSTSQPVQVSAGTTAQLLNKGHTVQRLSNSTIVANVRTLSNQVMASSGTNNAINSIVNASGSDVVGHKPQTNNSSDSTVSSGVNLNTTNR